MKKLLLCIFTVLMLFSLTACGDEDSSINSSSTSGTNAQMPEESQIAVPGYYVPIGMYVVDAYDLHDNGSYDFGEEKGTYSEDNDGNISLQPKDGSAYTLTSSGKYYRTKTKMSEDDEYGLAPAFNDDGHTNQAFTVDVGETTLKLELRDDGSYSFSYESESPVDSVLTDVVTYDGDYVLEDNVLNLTSGGVTFHFLFEDDIIYPIVFVKKTAENAADVEAVQAAAQTAYDDAAQSRWWTPPDDETEATIKAALIGTWYYTDGYGEYNLTFDDENLSFVTTFVGVPATSDTVSYTIQNGAIMFDLRRPSGTYTIIYTRVLPYTYKDGVLTLYKMLDIRSDEGLRDPTIDITTLSDYQYGKIA